MPATPRAVLAGGLSALLFATMLVFAISPSPGVVRAACGESLDEPEAAFAFDPPLSGFEVAGVAPLAVTVSWVAGAAAPLGSTAFLDWGDGSPPTPFSSNDCGDGIALDWPPQAHTHTYSAEGTYTLSWAVNSTVVNFNVPIAFAVVQAAQPSPTTPPPSTPTPLPATLAPSPGVASTAVAPAPTTGPAATSTPTMTPSPSPTAVTPGATAAAATPPPTVSPAAGPVVTPTPTSTAIVEPDIPAPIRSVPRLSDVATDAGTVATNLALAGVTLWVLFSSVLLNQVLQEHRTEIDARTSRLLRPLRRFGSGSSRSRGARRLIEPLVVLGLTGAIYGLLDPGFGFNRPSAVLFLSVILGVGLVTYACSGVEALVTRRTFGVAAAVRPYPISLAIAVGSVAISRIAGLQPGVIYGFVASCALIGSVTIDERQQGRVIIFPVVTAIVLSVCAWLVVEPLRGSAAVSSSFFGQVGIAAGLIVFIGGLEGVAFNMIPLSVTDGGKLFRWKRSVWAAVALLAAFLFWHVLLNRNRQSFDALRQAESLAMLALFLLYTSLSVGLWAYFRWRLRRIEPASRRE
jgi:hypothetical protein